jgi:hypothetical protein
MVVVEHGVDDGRALRLRIGDEIAHRVGGFVEEGADRRFARHFRCPS